MESAIFQFSSDGYSKTQTKMMDRELCERLSVVDKDNVTKFEFIEINGLEEIINNSLLDDINCWFRIFL